MCLESLPLLFVASLQMFGCCVKRGPVSALQFIFDHYLFLFIPLLVHIQTPRRAQCTHTQGTHCSLKIISISADSKENTKKIGTQRLLYTTTTILLVLFIQQYIIIIVLCERTRGHPFSNIPIKKSLYFGTKWYYTIQHSSTVLYN